MEALESPDNLPDEVRLFTAVALPPDTAARTADLLQRLQKGATFTGAHPTWVAAENVHITMVFLGAQPRDRVPALQEALNQAARKTTSFTLRLRGLHLFPNPKEPKVISLGIHGAVPQLEALREELAQELRSRDFPVESRPFRPHVTLARIKSMKGLSGLRQLLSGHQKIEPGPFSVEKLSLFQSTLSPSGPTYRLLYEAPLGAPAGQD